MKVFLTGGSGLLGSHVAERLRAGGRDVVALHRPGADTRFLAHLGCTLLAGELGDSPARHAQRMAGCDAILHAAGWLYGAPSLEEARRVNVDGTRRVLEGAVQAGVARAVHVSSVAVYGDLAGPLTEDSPTLPPLTPREYYARSKREAEDVAAGVHGHRGMKVTILRPCALWGERDRHFVPRLLRWLRRPVCPLPGGGRSRLALVYAGNLAVAAEAALLGKGSGEVFNLSEDLPVTLRSLAEGLALRVGLSPLFVGVPPACVRLGARVGEALGLRPAGAADFSLVRGARLGLDGNPYSSAKARRVLGWAPGFTLEEALDRVGGWIRVEDEINRGRGHER